MSEASEAFRARRRIAAHGDWMMFPSEQVSVAEARRWSARNGGRRMAPGQHMTLGRLEDGHFEVFMSDAEYHDHARVLARARGRVVVTGLGLGCIVRALFARGRVDHITVVEREADVVALVWPELAAAFGDRVALHHADALIGPMPNGRWDLAWHDIWPTVTAMNIPEMWKLRRRYDKRTRRQLCWAEGLCWRQFRDEARKKLLAALRSGVPSAPV